ncbi:hypothetical protein BS329_01180 [Amycolatopsis coloradensis]|uniref:Uncharacterized protein n=1 Tax=Amycolatopsis coloradensis TaxID=76021 RepID=A0A1R0L3I1_9PSEU|nr:hypothetical protein [Amycolatopsis coloradensis]OLZ57319.1 hypothetical protein BS329_01180 [Amycolatopsis coloradensis]
MKSTITEQQAYDKVENYIQGAFAALPAPAELKLFTRNRSECTDPTDKGPQGRFEISATYEVVGLDSARFPEHFVAISKWWESHDFEVLTDSRPTIQYLFARNTGDAFDMSLKANDLGKFYVGATSPCVWPNGTPEPQAPEAPAAAPPEPEPEPAPARKPRRAPVDDADFDQTDWADGGTSF